MNPGTSRVVARRPPSQGLAASAIPQSNQSLGVLALATPLDATIDVEAIDDDVGKLSARVFPQVINQPRRNHPVIIDLDDDLDDQVWSSGLPTVIGVKYLSSAKDEKKPVLKVKSRTSQNKRYGEHAM